MLEKKEKIIVKALTAYFKNKFSIVGEKFLDENQNPLFCHTAGKSLPTIMQDPLLPVQHH